MAVLDTAIQEKPKYFNDPWMAGSSPAITRGIFPRFDFFTRWTLSRRCIRSFMSLSSTLI
jgi:hypothetical protein